MNLVIEKTHTLSGKVAIPGSKSQSIRALLFGLLATGTSKITNLLICDDTTDAIHVLGAFGVTTAHHNELFELTSDGYPLALSTPSLYTGNSGITTHFILPLLGLRTDSSQAIQVDSGEQMRARPIHLLVEALRDLGLTIDYLKQPQQLPISISGKLRGGNTEISGLTSQYISALLLGLPCAEDDSEITIKNLQERTYMDMTLAWLNQQKITYHHECIDNIDKFFIKGRQRYHAFSANVSGDFSSASYLIAAAVLLPSNVELIGLNMTDLQSDKRLIPILQEMGADITISENRIFIQGGKPLQGITIDANDIPDLLPTLAVIGTQAYEKTTLTNVAHARIKETDRIHSMTEGLTLLGAKVEEFPDGMVIYPSKLTGASVKGYGDHRTVMALSVAGLLAEGTTIITGSEAINKTFPTFVKLMCALGARVEIQNEQH